MHSFLGLIVRGVLAVYLLQQVHKTWWKHYFWITFVEHCISISWKSENWSALILDRSGLFVTWTSGFVRANLLWCEQYVHADFDDLVCNCCSFIFAVVLSLLCHLNVGRSSFQFAVTWTVCSREFRTLYVIVVLFFLRSFLSFLCHLNMGRSSCQFAVMRAVCSREFWTLYVIVVLLFLRSFCPFFVTWTWGEVRANLLWREEYGHANFNDFLCHLNVGQSLCQSAVMRAVWSHKFQLLGIIIRKCD